MGDTQNLPKINADLLKAIDGKTTTPYPHEGQWKRKVIDNTGKQYDQRLDLIDGDWKWRSVWTGSYWYDPVVGAESKPLVKSVDAMADASWMPDFEGATLDENDQIVKVTPKGKMKFDPGPAGGDVKPQWILEDDTNKDKIFTAPPDFVKDKDGRLYITQDKKKFRVPKDAMKQKDVPYVYSKRAMDTFKELNPDGDYSEQLVSTAPISGKEAWALLSTGDTLKPTGKDIDASLGWKEKLLKRAESDPKARAMVRSRLNEAALQQLRAQMDFVRKSDGSLDVEKYNKALAEKKFFGPDLKSMKTHAAQLRTFAGSAVSSFVEAAVGGPLATRSMSLDEGISMEKMFQGAPTMGQAHAAGMYAGEEDIKAFQADKAKAEAIQNETERAVAMFKLVRKYKRNESDLKAWAQRTSAPPAFTNLDEAPFFSRIANKTPGAVGSTVGFITESALEGAVLGGLVKSTLGKASLVPVAKVVEETGIKLSPRLANFVATKNINIPAAVVGINGAFNEAGVEARDAYFNSFLKNMQEGKGYDEANAIASKASTKTYWGNVALLGATEWFLPTFKVIKSLTGTGQKQLAREFAIEGLKEAERRGVRSAFMTGLKTAGAAGLGGLQEGGQSVISSAASGEAINPQDVLDETVIGTGVELAMGGLGDIRESRLNKSVDGSAAPLGTPQAATAQPMGLPPAQSTVAPTEDFTARVAEHRARLIASPEARRQFTTIPDVVGKMSKEEKAALDVLRRKSVWSTVSDGLSSGLSPQDALLAAEEFSGSSRLAIATQEGASQKEIDKIKADYAAKREAATSLLAKFNTYADNLASSRAARDMELAGGYTPEEIASVRSHAKPEPTAASVAQAPASVPAWTEEQLQKAWENYADGHIDVGSKSILHKPSAAALNIMFNERVDNIIAPIREKADASGVSKPIVDRVVGYVKAGTPESLKTLGSLYTASHNLLVKAGVVRDGKINDQMVNNSPNDQIRAARDNVRMVHELRNSGLIDLDMTTSGRGPSWSVSTAPMQSMRDLALADVQSKWNSDHAMNIAFEAGFTGDNATAFKDAFMAFGRGDKGVVPGASEPHPTLMRTATEPDLVNSREWVADKSSAASSPEEVWDIVTAAKAVVSDLMNTIKSGQTPEKWWASRKDAADLVNNKLAEQGRAIRVKESDVPYINSTLAKQGILGYVESAKKFMSVAESAQEAGGTPADLFAAIGQTQMEQAGPEHFRTVRSPRYYFIDENGDMVSDKGVRRTPISALNDIADRLMAFTKIPALDKIPELGDLANGVVKAIQAMDKQRSIAMLLWHGVKLNEDMDIGALFRKAGGSEASISGFLENSRPIRDKSVIANVIEALTGRIMTPGEVKNEIEAGENQIATMLPAINNLGSKIAKNALELLNAGDLVGFANLREAVLKAAPDLARMNGWIGPRAPIVSHESGGLSSRWQAKERTAPTATGVAMKDAEGNIVKVPVKGFVEGMSDVLNGVKETDPAYPAMVALRSDIVSAANTAVGRKPKGTVYTKSGARVVVEPKREHMGKRIGVTAHAVEGAVVNKIMAKDASNAALDSAESTVAQGFMRMFMKDVATKFAELVNSGIEGETFRTPKMASAAVALVRMASQQAIPKITSIPDSIYRQNGTPDLAKLGHFAVEKVLDRLDSGRNTNELQEVMVFGDELEKAVQNVAAMVATRSNTYSKIADMRLGDINAKRVSSEEQILETGEDAGINVRVIKDLGADAGTIDIMNDQSVFGSVDSASLMERWEKIIELAKTEGDPGALADEKIKERALLRAAPMAVLMQVKDMRRADRATEQEVKHDFKLALADWLGTMAKDDATVKEDDMRYILSFSPGLTQRDVTAIVSVATKIANGTATNFGSSFSASSPEAQAESNSVLDKILRSSEEDVVTKEQTAIVKDAVAEEKKIASGDIKAMARLMALSDKQKEDAHFMAIIADSGEGASVRRGLALIPGLAQQLGVMNQKMATLRGAAKTAYEKKVRSVESQLRALQGEMLRATTRMMAIYADSVGMMADSKATIESGKNEIMSLKDSKVDLEIKIDGLLRTIRSSNGVPAEVQKAMARIKTSRSLIAAITKAREAIPGLAAKREELASRLQTVSKGLRSALINRIAEVDKQIYDINAKSMDERVAREAKAIEDAMSVVNKHQSMAADMRKPVVNEYVAATKELEAINKKIDKITQDIASAKSIVKGSEIPEGLVYANEPNDITLLTDRLMSFNRIAGQPHADMAIDMIESRLRKLFPKQAEAIIEKSKTVAATPAKTTMLAAENGSITNGAIESVKKTDGEIAAVKAVIAADVLGLDETGQNPLVDPSVNDVIDEHVRSMSDPENRGGLRVEGLYHAIKAIMDDSSKDVSPQEKRAIDDAVESERPDTLSTTKAGKHVMVGGLSLAVYMADPELGRFLMGTELAYYGVHWASMKIADKMGLPEGSTIVDVAKAFVAKHGNGVLSNTVARIKSFASTLSDGMSRVVARVFHALVGRPTGDGIIPGRMEILQNSPFDGSAVGGEYFTPIREGASRKEIASVLISRMNTYNANPQEAADKILKSGYSLNGLVLSGDAILANEIVRDAYQYVHPLRMEDPDVDMAWRQTATVLPNAVLDMAISRLDPGSKISIVTGPPAAGKTTLSYDLAQTSDLVIEAQRVNEAATIAGRLKALGFDIETVYVFNDDIDGIVFGNVSRAMDTGRWGSLSEISRATKMVLNDFIYGTPGGGKSRFINSQDGSVYTTAGDSKVGKFIVEGITGKPFKDMNFNAGERGTMSELQDIIDKKVSDAWLSALDAVKDGHTVKMNGVERKVEFDERIAEKIADTAPTTEGRLEHRPGGSILSGLQTARRVKGWGDLVTRQSESSDLPSISEIDEGTDQVDESSVERLAASSQRIAQHMLTASVGGNPELELRAANNVMGELKSMMRYVARKVDAVKAGNTLGNMEIPGVEGVEHQPHRGWTHTGAVLRTLGHRTLWALRDMNFNNIYKAVNDTINTRSIMAAQTLDMRNRLAKLQHRSAEQYNNLTEAIFHQTILEKRMTVDEASARFKLDRESSNLLSEISTYYNGTEAQQASGELGGEKSVIYDAISGFIRHQVASNMNEMRQIDEKEYAKPNTKEEQADNDRLAMLEKENLELNQTMEDYKNILLKNPFYFPLWRFGNTKLEIFRHVDDIGNKLASPERIGTYFLDATDNNPSTAQIARAHNEMLGQYALNLYKDYVNSMEEAGATPTRDIAEFRQIAKNLWNSGGITGNESGTIRRDEKGNRTDYTKTVNSAYYTDMVKRAKEGGAIMSGTLLKDILNQNTSLTSEQRNSIIKDLDYLIGRRTLEQSLSDQRSGIAGYNMDIKQVIGDHAFMIGSKISSLRNLPAIHSALEKLSGGEYSGIDRQDAQNYVMNALSPAYSKSMEAFSSYARAMVFYSTLAFKPSFGIVNALTQRVITTSVYLKSKYGGDTRPLGAGSSISGRLMFEIAGIGKSLHGMSDAKLDEAIDKAITKETVIGALSDKESVDRVVEQLRGIMRDAVRSGIFKETLTTFMAGDDGLSIRRLVESNPASRTAWTWTKNMAMYASEKSEGYNRIRDFVAQAIYSLDNGENRGTVEVIPQTGVKGVKPRMVLNDYNTLVLKTREELKADGIHSEYDENFRQVLDSEVMKKIRLEAEHTTALVNFSSNAANIEAAFRGPAGRLFVALRMFPVRTIGVWAESARVAHALGRSQGKTTFDSVLRHGIPVLRAAAFLIAIGGALALPGEDTVLDAISEIINSMKAQGGIDISRQWRNAYRDAVASVAKGVSKAAGGTEEEATKKGEWAGTVAADNGLLGLVGIGLGPQVGMGDIVRFRPGSSTQEKLFTAIGGVAGSKVSEVIDAGQSGGIVAAAKKALTPGGLVNSYNAIVEPYIEPKLAKVYGEDSSEGIKYRPSEVVSGILGISPVRKSVLGQQQQMDRQDLAASDEAARKFARQYLDAKTPEDRDAAIDAFRDYASRMIEAGRPSAIPDSRKIESFFGIKSPIMSIRKSGVVDNPNY